MGAGATAVGGKFRRFQISDYRFQIRDFRFQIRDFRFQIKDYRFITRVCCKKFMDSAGAKL